MKKNNNLELTTRLILTFFGLKITDKKEYSDETKNSKLVYIFKNYEELKQYFFSNGLAALDKEAVEMLVVLRIEKNGTIVALKDACDRFIRDSKNNLESKNYQLKKVHYK